jgi:large subunit ribosomal protein L24
MGRPALKKGDLVIVTKGKDKGKTGKVLVILPEKNRVIVEKVNFVKEFIRPDRSRNIQGGIMEKEAPLSISNVLIYCPECEKGVRVKRKALEDGTRIRVCQKCELSLEKQK